MKQGTKCCAKTKGTGYFVHKAAAVQDTVVVQDIVAVQGIVVAQGIVVVQGIVAAQDSLAVAGRKIVQAVDPGVATPGYRAAVAVGLGRAKTRRRRAGLVAAVEAGGCSPARLVMRGRATAMGEVWNKRE